MLNRIVTVVETDLINEQSLLWIYGHRSSQGWHKERDRFSQFSQQYLLRNILNPQPLQDTLVLYAGYLEPERSPNYQPGYIIEPELQHHSQKSKCLTQQELFLSSTNRSQYLHTKVTIVIIAFEKEETKYQVANLS